MGRRILTIVIAAGLAAAASIAISHADEKHAGRHPSPGAAATAIADEGDTDAAAKTDDASASGKAAPVGKPKRVTADRSGTFNGRRVDYTVVAGETFLKNDKGEPVASIFSTSYIKRDVANPATRPVTFLFNGGPGSASLWLHMGVFGPKRVQVPGDAENPGPPPYALVDNAQSILDVTDLVFIDPVATGFSHVIGKGEDKNFTGYKEDAQSIAQFVRLWLGEHKRWNSPKFLGGESYGGIRTGAMLPELGGTDATVSLNGIILLSPALSYTGISFVRGNDVPFVDFLPTYAATAWYHKKIKDTAMGFDAFLKEVRQFAISEYAPALIEGSRMSADRRQAVIAKLARYTGLSPVYIDHANLRIEAARFMKELLRDEGKSVGRIDSRYLGDDYDSVGEHPDVDPSLNGMSGAYSAAINSYFSNDLGIDMGREYKVLGSLYKTWNYASADSGPFRGVDVAPLIGDAMRQNKGMRAFIATGYYDLATPFFQTENEVANNGVPADRVIINHYPGGHMMYVQPDALNKLTQDIRAFILMAAPPSK